MLADKLYDYLSNMNVEILNNPELPFALICMMSSLLCGRISLVYARGGVNDQDFFSLTIGTLANFAWIPSVLWFFLEGNWIIAVTTMVISIFGLCLLVTPHRHLLWRIRNILRLISIISFSLMWHSYLMQ